ncbi:hypothetical protein CBR_g54959 [Chara braunii]|uniref:Uncharacterized protein n=1 Tax=Chara braunii TaxID=69332 RepID=A0A388K7E7_CHABU|nr:hypothetical protein CBR_g54959 [Chara braunii]|eukprot:GBG65980.1 hypothetical protein CBR_g54959 [Chara braunii]
MEAAAREVEEAVAEAKEETAEVMVVDGMARGARTKTAKVVKTGAKGPRSSMTYRPPTSHGRVPQAACTRSQNKAGTSQASSQAPCQAPPRKEPEPERRREVVEVLEEEDEDDDKEDERLRQEEDRRAELRARKIGVKAEAEPSQPDSVPKRKKYAVRLEEGFEVERMVDRLLEGHNDVMNLKDILASTPRLRDDVEVRMQRLRASPVGCDGLPIRLEEGNAEEFIPAYEQYMRDQGTVQEEWMQTLLLGTRRAERPLARQIRDRARDWEDCQAQLRQAFRRPEPEMPEPMVERRQRSERLLGPGTGGGIVTRRGRKALARREEEPVEPAQAAEPPPTYGFEQVKFRQITSSDLRGPLPKLPEEGEDVLSETPLRSLEAHLDATCTGGYHFAQEGGRDKGQEEDERARARTIVDSRLAEYAAEHSGTEMPASDEPPSELPHVKKGASVEAPTRETHEARTGRAPRETAEEKSVRVQAHLAEIYEKQVRMEAAGVAPTPPIDRRTSEQKIDQMWARYESRRDAARQRSQETGQEDERADEMREIGDLRFFAARMAIERAERRICQAATTSFHRYILLGDELAVRKLEVEQLSTQLAEEKAENRAWRTHMEVREAEWEKRLQDMAAAVERLSATKVVDQTEQSRYGIQGERV